MSATVKENVQETATSFVAPYIEAKYNAQHQVVEYKWIGHVKDQDAHIAFEKILNLCKNHKAKYIIADVTAFQGGSVQAAKWSNDVWSVQLSEAGVKKIAVNLPKSIFGEFSLKISLGEKFLTVMDVQKFTSLEQAYLWFAKND
jgi:hypothetical protein